MSDNEILIIVFQKLSASLKNLKYGIDDQNNVLIESPEKDAYLLQLTAGDFKEFDLYSNVDRVAKIMMQKKWTCSTSEMVSIETFFKVIEKTNWNSERKAGVLQCYISREIVNSLKKTIPKWGPFMYN